MGAIANFKKRREAQRAALAELAQKGVAAVKEIKAVEPENEALSLLAALLGCEVDQAFNIAKTLVENGAYISGLTEQQAEAINEQMAVDLAAEGAEKTVNVTAQRDKDGKVTVTAPGVNADEKAALLDASAENVNAAAADLQDAASNVDAAANTVSGAASELDETASKLAYTADDIGQATSELKQATAAIKKPSAARQSSRGAKAAAQKNSSKK